MTNNLHSASPSERKLPWAVITRVVFVAILIAVMYLPAEDMVGHRFFRGGWLNHQDMLEP